MGGEVVELERRNAARELRIEEAEWRKAWREEQARLIEEANAMSRHPRRDQRGGVGRFRPLPGGLL